MEIKNPLENGLVKDWELLEQIYNFTFKEALRVDPSVTPLLLSEASFNTKFDSALQLLISKTK